MATIINPVIPGMAPDPSILRVGERYFIANSTFHWTPGIQIFESADLARWTLRGQVLTHGEVDLRGTNTPAGIWAPHLSHDPQTGRYWIVYSHMVNMAGREFCADTYTMWASSIDGPWSDPLYVTSIGFDPALFHDGGKHYVSILEWESRELHQAPGHIVVAEVDLEGGGIRGSWHRVTQGFTTRGCVEAPQLYKRNGYYYLILASGGTGYGHGVEIGRSKNVFGPYEPHPSGEPIVTSSPRHLFSLGDPNAGQFQMYNPTSVMQKSGHGSLVETPTGECYLAHLMSRPLPGTTLNPLGRETSLQKMRWTEAGWLEMADGTNVAKMVVPGIGESTDRDGAGTVGADTADVHASDFDVTDSFDGPNWDANFLTPYRTQDPSWVSTTQRPRHLRIHGGDSLFSQINPAIMATRATSFAYDVRTHVEFHPDHYSESAGLGLYYDSNNWIYARLFHSEEQGGTRLGILQAELGSRKEFAHDERELPEGIVELRIRYTMGVADFLYRLPPDSEWSPLLVGVDVAYLSDEGVNGEPGEIGGFTGLFNFIAAVDSHQRDSFADFAHYAVINSVNGDEQ